MGPFGILPPPNYVPNLSFAGLTQFQYRQPRTIVSQASMPLAPDSHPTTSTLQHSNFVPPANVTNVHGADSPYDVMRQFQEPLLGPVSNVVSRTIETAMTRVHGEISRSISRIEQEFTPRNEFDLLASRVEHLTDSMAELRTSVSMKTRLD